MKKRKIVLFTILGLVIVAGGIVVPSIVSPKYTLIGKWRMKTVAQNGDQDVKGHDIIKDFKEDGTETSSFGDQVQSGTYTVNGDALTEYLHSPPNVRAGKADGPHTSHYKIDGSILTLAISAGKAHTDIQFDRVR